MGRESEEIARIAKIAVIAKIEKQRQEQHRGYKNGETYLVHWCLHWRLK